VIVVIILLSDNILSINGQDSLESSLVRNIKISTACGSGPSTTNNTFCSGQGRCSIDPTSSFLVWPTEGFCKCNRGYFGNKCQLNACADSDGVECNNNGICIIDIMPVGGVIPYNEVCKCSPGYFGDRCEINPCDGQTCPIGKSCVGYERLVFGNKVQGYYCAWSI